MICRRWRRRLCIGLQLSSPALFGLLGLMGCATLARYDRGVYWVVATLVFTALYVEITWGPLRDTAGLAILHHSRSSMRVLFALIITTPLVGALFSLLFS